MACVDVRDNCSHAGVECDIGENDPLSLRHRSSQFGIFPQNIFFTHEDFRIRTNTTDEKESFSYELSEETVHKSQEQNTTFECTPPQMQQQ